MPCNTPPPPNLIEEMDDIVEDDPNELDYEFLPDSTSGEYDDSVVTFFSHEGVNEEGDKYGVFCCRLNQSGTLAVSGGQDDKAYVWSTENGEIKFECPGHSDSVTSVNFNHDDSLVASAGMDGLVQVFDVATGNKVWSFEASEINWIEWHPTANILFAGTEDGTCWKWSVPGEDICSLFQTGGAASTCGKLFDNGSKCVVGYRDGSIKVWNTENVSLIGSVTGKDAHESSVNVITCNSDGSLMASGSVDGTAKIIRSSNCRVLKTLQCSQSEEEVESVEGVGFLNGNTFLAVGSNSGSLRIFDVSTYVLRSLASFAVAITKVVCDESEPFVYISSGGGVEKVDARTTETEIRWNGHENCIFDFVISKNKEKILTAADDSLCKIFLTS